MLRAFDKEASLTAPRNQPSVPQSVDKWHLTMYDRAFAHATIGSKKFAALARKEAHFLIRTLDLKKGQTVLDVPCGTGRHAAVFARASLQVTGIDISRDCLRMARKAIGRLKVTLRQRDMADLSAYRSKFDAVFNLFTSFGYFSTDKKNEKVLREMISALKPGGRIVIQTINRDWLLKIFAPSDWREQNGKYIFEVRKYDPKTHYNEVKMFVFDLKTKQAKHYYHRIRLYSKPEMVRLLKKCGLQNIRVYGNFEGQSFEKYKSSHPIYLGQKPFQVSGKSSPTRHA
jgi:ubiquinone/menaquinone biosynthesis C-methylase UbiE